MTGTSPTGALDSPSTYGSVEELRSALRLSMNQLLLVQADCVRMKKAQSDFQELWRGMERLMSQHKPVEPGQSPRESTGGGSSSSLSPDSIKELLERIDGALSHVDQVLARDSPQSSKPSSRSPPPRLSDGIHDRPADRPTRRTPRRMQDDSKPTAGRSSDVCLHADLSGAIPQVAAGKPPTPPTSSRLHLITAAPFISPIPMSKTPRDLASPQTPTSDRGHITVYGLQMCDSAACDTPTHGGYADLSLLETSITSPIVSPLPKYDPARAVEEYEAISYAQAQQQHVRSSTLAIRGAKRPGSESQGMHSTLAEMRVCADRISDVLLQEENEKRCSASAGCVNQPLLECNDGQVTASLGFADSMNGRVVYPEAADRSGASYRSCILSPTPSPPPSRGPRTAAAAPPVHQFLGGGVGPSANYRLEMERLAKGEALVRKSADNDYVTDVPLESSSSALRRVDLCAVGRHAEVASSGLGGTRMHPVKLHQLPPVRREVEALPSAPLPMPARGGDGGGLAGASIFSNMMARGTQQGGLVSRPVVLSTSKAATLFTRKDINSAGGAGGVYVVMDGYKENAVNGGLVQVSTRREVRDFAVARRPLSHVR